MRSLSTIIFIAFTLSALGKGINMEFIVKTDRGICSTLNLKKDNTFKYISYSISWDSQSVLDSGTYQLENNIITFNSKDTQSKDNFADKKYYIKERKIKHYESEYVSFIIYCKKKTLFGKKIVALLKGPNDSIILTCKILTDPIKIKSLKPDTTIKQWVYNNIVTSDLDSTHWKNVFESKNLHILSVKSLFGSIRGVYFLIDDEVYFSNDPTSMKFNKHLVDKCYKEHLINSRQKNEIIKSIAEWTKN